MPPRTTAAGLTAQPTPADPIKKFCPIFAAIGVTMVCAEYEGSGDSGDFENVTFRFDDAVSYTDSSVSETLSAQATNKRRMPMDTFKQTYVNNGTAPDRLMTAEQFDEFYEHLFNLLPGGWEINEGSYGEILVDVRKQQVEHVHNERITDVNTTRQLW